MVAAKECSECSNEKKAEAEAAKTVGRTEAKVMTNADKPSELPADPWRQPAIREHTQLLLNSFQRWLGRDLVKRAQSTETQAEMLFTAPCVVVSHGVQEDPILNYGNQAALQLWEMDFDTLTSIPSRLTAEPMHRDERAQLLARTTANGFVDDYSGIRISSTGKRFLIRQAIVWNLLSEADEYLGQAAMFSDWEWLPVAAAGDERG